jgi:hypothetical protein
MPKAVDEMRRAVGILPKQVLYRTNLALFASYASDFQPRSERRERSKMQNSAHRPWLAQLGQGQVSETIETYQRLAAIDALGASLAASGLGDLAWDEGRFGRRANLRARRSSGFDLQEPRPSGSEVRVAGLRTRIAGQKGPAVIAATNALENSKAVKIRFSRHERR